MSDPRGIKWPFQFYAGRVVTSEGDDHVRESIRQIIGIGKGEYLMKPDFGCHLNHRVFDPINVSAMVDGDVREALEEFEPRIIVNGTSADFGKAADGIVGISVDYSIKGSGQSDITAFDLRS